MNKQNAFYKILLAKLQKNSIMLTSGFINTLENYKKIV